MQDTRLDSHLTANLKRAFLLAQQQQQQQQKQQHMTKAYHETKIKIQICLAEKVYSVKTKGNNRHRDYKAIRVGHMKKRVHNTHSDVFY